MGDLKYPKISQNLKQSKIFQNVIKMSMTLLQKCEFISNLITHAETSDDNDSGNINNSNLIANIDIENISYFESLNYYTQSPMCISCQPQLTVIPTECNSDSNTENKNKNKNIYAGEYCNYPFFMQKNANSFKCDCVSISLQFAVESISFNQSNANKINNITHKPRNQIKTLKH